MSADLKKFDEEKDNPFDLMALFGWHVSDQEDDEDQDEDENEEEDWDDDVYWANVWFCESSFGYWGLFADGLAWDGSRDLSNDPQADELSLFAHVRLVMDTRREERLRTHLP